MFAPGILHIPLGTHLAIQRTSQLASTEIRELLARLGVKMGEVIAAVSLAGQLFTGCVQACHFLLTAHQFEDVSQKYLIKLCIEQARLLIWGRTSGLADGPLNPSLRNIASVIVRVLEYMQNSLADAADLSQKYGLEFSSPAPNPAAQSATTVSTTWTTSVLIKSQHQKLLESKSYRCRAVREAGASGEYGYVVTIAGLILMLIMTINWAARNLLLATGYAGDLKHRFSIRLLMSVGAASVMAAAQALYV